MAKTRIAQIAQEVRKELKKEFPGTKFSVRSNSYSGGGSVNVRWTDFPTMKAVKEVTQKLESIHYDDYTGEILLGANYFIFENQDLSEELREKAKERIPENVPEHDHHYWINRALEEMYEEMKQEDNSESNNKVEIKEENKDKPATKRQLFAIHCITQQDTRNWKLTRREASEIISQSKQGINVNEILENKGLA